MVVDAVTVAATNGMAIIFVALAIPVTHGGGDGGGGKEGGGGEGGDGGEGGCSGGGGEGGTASSARSDTSPRLPMTGTPSASLRATPSSAARREMAARTMMPLMQLPSASKPRLQSHGS